MGFKSENIFRGKIPGESFWEPEASFSKADFTSSAKQSTEKDSSHGETLHAKNPSSPGDSVSENGNLPGGLKSWAPPRISRDESKVLRHTTDKNAAKAGGRTVPESREEVRSGKTTGNTTPRNVPRVLPDRFVRNAVYSHPERTIEVLRNWYWEKKGNGMGESYKRIHPHLRIFIVLSSAGSEAIRFLYGFFTPTERRQIHTILKSYPPVDPREVDVVRRAFIERVTIDF